MTLDAPTLLVVLGISHLFQLAVFAVLYAIHRGERGMRWWLAWSGAAAAAFAFTLVRQVPSLFWVSAFGTNLLVVLGVTFLYVGIARFFGQRESRPLLAAILVSHAASITWFAFGAEDYAGRTVATSAALAILAFLSIRALLAGREPSNAGSATFLAVILSGHGLFVTFRAAAYLWGAPTRNLLDGSLFNVGLFVDALVTSMLLTLGLVLLVDQRAHSELVVARDHFERLFTTIPDAALITRLRDGTCLAVNEGFETLVGYTLEEALGRTTLELNLYPDPDDRAGFVAQLQATGACSGELRFRRKDGRLFHGSVVARVVTLHGEPHIFSVTRDVTERKVTEDALAESTRAIQELNVGLERRVAERTAELVAANRSLEALLHSIAHDLRAPLRAIDGFSGILEAEHAARLDAEGLRLLGLVRGGAQKMDRLIHDLVGRAHASSATSATSATSRGRPDE